ncbi:unnamed protein product [Caenorhabditis bovis]|uniref:Protein-S-isoprenylcysteine O-methyltransferase n=1 Tax=Caenorhabditis bovis TaxID=2654633 RepID=A0A8S1F4L3_9PELO|nr:unnamed protein product [Caenorhabditis bovis]
MAPISIRKQLQVDVELRSVLAFFFASFVLVFAFSLFSMLIAALLLVCIPPSSYFISKHRNQKFQSTTQASILGVVFGFALSYSIFYNNYKSSCLSRYFAILAIFHFTEYVFTAFSNRRSLQPDSFLLNHSVGYWMAASTSWIEFLIELYIFPFMKSHSLSMLGVLCCIIGEVIRKTAMMHAGSGFTHKLAMAKRSDHVLVTEGIYAWMRHPGYCGWFIWAVSTQLILCNPICTFIYTYVTWHFFSQRIYDEERDLIKFFGSNYIAYQNQVMCGVPFVTGYKMPQHG